MREENYSFAVASVRIFEKSLLSADYMEQLLLADSYNAVLQQLVDRGFMSTMPLTSDDTFLQNQLIATWDFIKDIAPDVVMFDALIVKNDFHNLKAAIKCCLSNLPYESYFIYPCLEDPIKIAELVTHRKFDQLPSFMISAAKEAYDVLVRTQDGQFADIYIDTAALNCIRDMGRKSSNALIDSLTELFCVSANLKTAIRAAKTKKDIYFLNSALSECDTISKTNLALAASKGEEALTAYILTTQYAACIESLKISQSAFEKWLEDLCMRKLDGTKYIFFGPEPIAAYYLAREAEIKNIRILLSGKQTQVETNVIRERMRKLYV